MDKRRLFLRGILCIAIMAALAGCQKKTAGRILPDRGKQEIGGYVEEEIEMPLLSPNSGEVVLSAFMGREQIWKVYTAKVEWIEAGYMLKAVNLYSKPFHDDGKKKTEWKRESVEWIKEEITSYKPGKNFIADLPVIVEGEEGNDYLFVRYYYEGQKKNSITNGSSKDQIIVFCMDNRTEKVTSLKLKVNICNEWLLDAVAVTESGNIVMGSGGEGIAFLYSGDNGKLLSTVDFGMKNTSHTSNGIDVEVHTGITTTGNKLIGRGKEGISVYDTEQGEMNTIPYEFPNGSNSCFSKGKKGGILIGDRKGIHRISKSGTLWETIIEGSQTAYGLGEGRLVGIYLLGENENEIAAVVKDTTKYRLFRYKYDETKPAVTNTLTVYSLYYNDSIQTHINNYQIRHRDVKVNYIVGKEKDGSPDGDAIRAFNTELLNGKGTDIVVLDGLPVKSYLEKGILSDIGGLVKEIEKSGKLSENILSPFINEEGEMYRIPLSFCVPLALGKSEAVKCLGSTEKMAAYIKSGDGTPIMDKMSLEETARLLLTYEYSSLFEGGSPDIKDMKQFLEGLEVIAKNINSGPEDGKNGDYFSKLVEDKIEIGVPSQSIGLLDTANALYLRDKEEMELKIINRSFIPSNMIAINKKSHKNQLALDFLRYILEDEPEEYVKSHEDAPGSISIFSYEFGRYPVSAAILEKQATTMAMIVPREYTIKGKQYKVEVKRKEFMSLIEEIKTLDQPLEVEQEVFGMVVDGAVSCLAGRVTAEQAANDICNKIRLYQAEKG